MLRLIQIEPGRTDAYSRLGVIDWQIAIKGFAKRRKAGYQNPSGIQLLAPLRAQLLPYIEEGFRHAQVVMQKEPEDGDAMAFMNLLTRAKAAVVIARGVAESASSG